MSDESPRSSPEPVAWSGRARALTLVVLLLVVAGAMALLPKARPGEEIGKASAELSSRPEGKAGAFSPTAAQWAALTIEPVQEHTFRPELLTDGKIAVDETPSTPVFSPYSGRVTKIAAEPGDTVQAGQLLFALEATDMVQAQNDFIAAVAGVETARSRRVAGMRDRRPVHGLADRKCQGERRPEDTSGSADPIQGPGLLRSGVY